MIKKALFSGLIVIMTISMTACGTSGKQEEKQEDEVQETVVQQEESDIAEVENEEEGYIEEDESFYIEEICYMYNDYLLGNITEEEMADVEEIYGVTIDEAESIFMENADAFGFGESLAVAERPYFEATEEIKNANLMQLKMQVADMMLEQYMNVADCIEQIENSKLPFSYEYNPDTLVSGDSAYKTIEVYLDGEKYMKINVCNPPRYFGDKETRKLSDCVAYYIEVVDYSNVYYAGGLPALDGGITREEFDTLIQNNYGDLSEKINKYETTGNGYQVTYRMSGYPVHLSNYLLQCDDATVYHMSYFYRAQFDETGQNLQKVTIESSGESLWNKKDINEGDVIIER